MGKVLPLQRALSRAQRLHLDCTLGRVCVELCVERGSEALSELPGKARINGVLYLPRVKEENEGQ